MSQIPAVYRTPTLDPIEIEVLRLIDDLRDDLRHRVAQPRRWLGTLRRTTFARAVQGSNSIEGYNASLDDVAAAVQGEPTLDASLETQLALAGYRDAMTYVLQVAEDEHAEIDEGMIKALHFMMLKHDLAKSPGRWRPGYIGVRNEATEQIVYEGPDAELTGDLVDSMLETLHQDDAPTLVRAAMAHLNLVMIHPFRDGNGRMARCLQTLVITRDRINAPVFSSVEEYLGRNTEAYYEILADVGQGGWHPRERCAALDQVHVEGALPSGEDPSAAHRGDRAALCPVLRTRGRASTAGPMRGGSRGHRARSASTPQLLPIGRGVLDGRGDLRADRDARPAGDGQRPVCYCRGARPAGATT